MPKSDISKHIFISYARTDGQEHAARLDSDLRAAGYQTWRDLRNLNEYQDFSAEIETNIQQASHVIVCVTPSIDANPSSFVRREIIYAESKGKPIIPLVFPQATVPTLINHLTWIPFIDKNTQSLDYNKGLDQLLGRLKALKEQTRIRDNSDPYRDYLTALYDQIVRYLNLTVFSLLTLQSDATPEAVESGSKNVLPMAFWAMAGVADKINDTRQFNNLNEAFEAYKGRVLLLGEPGGGKTTTLFAFARDAVARRLEDITLPLPILVPISTWDSQKQTPIADWLAQTIPILKKEDIGRLIDAHKALLLLDGLDELEKDKEEQEDIETTANKSANTSDDKASTVFKSDPRSRFIALIPTDSPIIITCRVKDYSEIDKKVKLSGAVTLKPLNNEQMKDYLKKLPDLWEALIADKKLRNVARTPLLLSLFTYAYKQANPEELQQLRNLQNSPSELRDKIFETYVQQRYIYEKRRMEAHLEKIPCSLEEIHHILGNFAMTTTMFSKKHKLDSFKSNFISTSMTQMSLEEFLTLAEQLHLIVRPTVDNISFIHLLLQDYFAFQFVSKEINSDDLTVQINAVRWLEQFDDVRAFKLIVRFLGNKNNYLRRSALSILGRINDARAIKHLEKMLLDKNQYWVWESRVCDFAALALKRIGTGDALATLETWQMKEGNRKK